MPHSGPQCDLLTCVQGIGFKSVFKASSRPEVHSGPYHLQFDKRKEMGFIVPQPVKPPLEWDPASGTTVILPLDDADDTEMAPQTLRDFRVHLTEIRPTLLLFLHRLRRIELVDTIGGTSRMISREGRADPDPSSREPPPTMTSDSEVIGLLDETRAGDTPPLVVRQDWLVVRALLDVKVERAGVQTTELALAFPLCKDIEQERADGTRPPLPNLPVFAYLPLRSCN